jgi:hypothetical protein
MLRFLVKHGALANHDTIREGHTALLFLLWCNHQGTYWKVLYTGRLLVWWTCPS